jgi:hypothetical protein
MKRPGHRDGKPAAQLVVASSALGALCFEKGELWALGLRLGAPLANRAPAQSAKPGSIVAIAAAARSHSAW